MRNDPRMRRTESERRSGELPGTVLILVRRHHGFRWAALCNTQDKPDGKSLAGLIEPLIHQAIDEVQV